MALSGSRIGNIENLQQYTTELSQHVSCCEGAIILNGERRQGLATIFTGKCSKCSHTITLETSSKVKGPGKNIKWQCNLAAVWG